MYADRVVAETNKRSVKERLNGDSDEEYGRGRTSFSKRFKPFLLKFYSFILYISRCFVALIIPPPSSGVYFGSLNVGVLKFETLLPSKHFSTLEFDFVSSMNFSVLALETFFKQKLLGNKTVYKWGITVDSCM